MRQVIQNFHEDDDTRSLIYSIPGRRSDAIVLQYLVLRTVQAIMQYLLLLD